MAELAKMNDQEQWAYRESLKRKRDYYSVQRTLLEKGNVQGQAGKAHEVAVNLLKANKLTVAEIADAIGHDLSFVQTIKAQLEQGKL